MDLKEIMYEDEAAAVRHSLNVRYPVENWKICGKLESRGAPVELRGEPVELHILR